MQAFIRIVLEVLMVRIVWTNSHWSVAIAITLFTIFTELQDLRHAAYKKMNDELVATLKVATRKIEELFAASAQHARAIEAIVRAHELRDKQIDSQINSILRNGQRGSVSYR
jgi:hypothetical protein